MTTLNATRIALHALGRNKLRSILTALGIIIGVGCVITMMGLGEGTKEQMEDQVRQMGSNTLSVRPGEQRTGAIKQGSGLFASLPVATANHAPALLARAQSGT